MRRFIRGSGSLPARACGAIHPCGKASNPPGRRVGGRRRLRPPWGPRCGRRHRATAPRGRSRPRWPAPRRWGAGGPPPGRRRPVPPAGRGRRPQRCAATPGAHRCGGPGAAPPAVRGYRSGARDRGFRRGAAPPSPAPMYAHWVGWPSCRSGLGDHRHQGTRRRCCGHAASPGRRSKPFPRFFAIGGTWFRSAAALRCRPEVGGPVPTRRGAVGLYAVSSPCRATMPVGDRRSPPTRGPASPRRPRPASR